VATLVLGHSVHVPMTGGHENFLDNADLVSLSKKAKPVSKTVAEGKAYQSDSHSID